MMDILGTSGLDVELDTGRPREIPQSSPKVDRARAHLNETRLQSWRIEDELHKNSEVLRIFLEQYRNRLLEIAQNDTVLSGLEAAIRAIRVDLEFKPKLAEKVAKNAMGSRLLEILEAHE